jgi:hypothetical protein
VDVNKVRKEIYPSIVLFSSLQMMLSCHQQPPLPEHFYTEKSLYSRWATRIKMLNTNKDGKDTSLKALKLVRRFIKDWIS